MVLLRPEHPDPNLFVCWWDFTEGAERTGISLVASPLDQTVVWTYCDTTPGFGSGTGGTVAQTYAAFAVDGPPRDVRIAPLDLADLRQFVDRTVLAI